MNMVWLCDLLSPIESNKSDRAPVLRLGLRGLDHFCLLLPASFLEETHKAEPSCPCYPSQQPADPQNGVNPAPINEAILLT